MRQLLSSIRASKLRHLHTAAAAALAVGLVSGTLVLSDTVDAGFERAATASPDDVDLIVRAASEFAAVGNSLPERSSVPPSLLSTVQAVPGVQSAWGLVWGYAQLVDKEGKAIAVAGLPTVGTSWTPNQSLASGRPPTQPGEVVIDAVTARQHGFGLGDRIKVLFQGAVEEFTIRGIRLASDLIAATLATFDLQTAQRVLGRNDQVDAIAVQTAPGVPVETVRARLGAALPDPFEAVTNDQAAREAKESWTKALRFLTTGLLVFAAVSLLVGGFIIFNTFSILVAQRTRELGLLRSLGASRRQVMASVLAEALAVGIVASAAGVLLGYGAAHGLLALMKAFGLGVPAASVALVPRTAVAGLLAGVTVTAVAAILPARRATTVTPLAGMAAADGRPAPAHGRRLLMGAAATGTGLTILLSGLFGWAGPSRPAVGVGVLTTFAGLAVLAPLAAPSAARALGAPLVRWLGEPGRLARENAMRNPHRTATTAAALTIGLGLIGVVAILAASMKASAQQAVHETLRADFVVRPGGTSGFFAGIPPAVAERLRETPEVAVVSEVRGGQWGLDGKTQTLLAVDPATVARVHRLDTAGIDAARRLGDGDVLVRASVARRHGWAVGDEVPMTFARSGTQRMRLAATYGSGTAVNTDYIVSLRTYEANYAQQLDAEIRLRLSAGISAVDARARIEKGLADFPGAKLMDRSEVLAASEDQVNRILVPVTGILVLSVLIALLGVANTLALSIHERTREIGLLRAIGMAGGQLRSMIRSEAMIIALLGAAVGVVVAVVFGSVLVAAMADLGLTRLVVPVGQLAAWMAVTTAAGLVAASAPARKAGKLAVLEAVARP